MKKNNSSCNYDFTLWAKDHKGSPAPVTVSTLRDRLGLIAKKWTFQLEDAGSGEHYQGRFSLKIKKRIGEFDLFNAHLSRTSCENMNNMFYVTKEETRIGGPWSDSDIYIPKQVREIYQLRPWQTAIYDNIGIWDTRTINVIYDTIGNIGKSTLVGYLCCKTNDVATIPALNNYKDIMGMVLGMPTKKMYLIDMPRGMDKSNQGEFFSAIEHIKNGHAFDLRYTYKEKWFDCPNIWVFTNVMPSLGLLSSDRWKLWRVSHGILEALTL